MSDDFIDSNVFVYLFDETDERKREIADGIVKSALQDHSASISFQVVQEILNAVTRKLPTPMTAVVFSNKYSGPCGGSTQAWRSIAARSVSRRATATASTTR